MNPTFFLAFSRMIFATYLHAIKNDEVQNRIRAS